MNNYSKYKDGQLYLLLKGNKEEAEAAFSEIYSRYSQRVFAYCLRVVGNSEDAKDIYQEVFIKFFKSANEKQVVDNIPSYLIVTARHLCINHFRSQKSSVQIQDYQLVTNDEGYEQKELLQLISNALEMLDFEDRESFVLRQYQGLSYNEIAVIVGDTVTAIRNRVWRAKEKIRNILSPYLVDLSK